MPNSLTDGGTPDLGSGATFEKNIRSLLMALRNQFPITFCINFLTRGSYCADWHRKLHHLFNDEFIAPAYPNKRYPKQLRRQAQWYGVFEEGEQGWHCHGGVWLPRVNALGETLSNHLLLPIKKRIERAAQGWRPGTDFYLETTKEPERCISYNLKHFTANTECIWEYLDWHSAVMHDLFEPYQSVFYPFDTRRGATK